MLHADQKPKKKVDVIIPKEKVRKNPKSAIVSCIILLIGSIILGYFNVQLNVQLSDKENQEQIEVIIDTASKIELADNQEIETILETEDGEIEVESLPVVDMVDGGEIQVVEDDLDLGKGEFYPFETPQEFKDATLGKCIDLDGKWGAQCVDLANAFWKEYTNRWITTCGTGTARGIWDCKDENAGKEFKLITNANDIKTGDFIIFDGGAYGHVGMALGKPNKGYVSLLGENQGGTSCAGGGSATNIINISLKTFKGAFRPKIYDLPKVPDTGIVKPESAIERKD